MSAAKPRRSDSWPGGRVRQWMLGHLSIRQRLALWYTALLAITLVLFSVIVYTVAQNQLQSSVQEEVKTQAASIASVLRYEYVTLSGSATPSPGATTTPGTTPTPSASPTATPLPHETPGATTAPTPAPTPDPKTSQDIQQQLINNVPDVLKRLDFGFEVINTQKQLKFISQSLNSSQLPLNADVLDSALQGVPGSYTARSESSLLAIYAQPIVYDVNGVSDGSSKPSVIGVVLTAKPLDDVNGTLNTLSRLLVTGDLIALLFASLGGWLIAESGLRPIATVTRAARAIAHNASRASLGTRVSYSGPNDEVGELVTTFNDMLASIERVANAQRRFVADASHELRAPLTTIKGSLDFLRRAPDLSEAERRATIEDAYAEAERMANLVSDLLLLARVDAASSTYGLKEAWLDEQLRTRREPIQLDELAMDIFRHGRAQLHARHKDLHLSVTNIEPVTIIGDPGQIRQLALILLDNAIKYTPAGGKIRISVTRNGNRAAFSIADTGIGIRAEDRPHIFERFYRADQARERDEHGSGLGLAIARWIAGAHDGDISVHSQQGQGSTFTVLLPAVPTADGKTTTKPQAVAGAKRESRTPPIGIGSIYPLARLARSVSGPRKPNTSKSASSSRHTAAEARASRRRQQRSHKDRP